MVAYVKHKRGQRASEVPILNNAVGCIGQFTYFIHRNTLHFRWTLSPEWAIILATIQFDPLPTVKKEEVSKKVVDVEEPVVKKARYSDDKENSFSQFTSKKERSKMYSGKVGKTSPYSMSLSHKYLFKN